MTAAILFGWPPTIVLDEDEMYRVGIVAAGTLLFVFLRYCFKPVREITKKKNLDTIIQDGINASSPRQLRGKTRDAVKKFREALQTQPATFLDVFKQEYALIQDRRSKLHDHPPPATPMNRPASPVIDRNLYPLPETSLSQKMHTKGLASKRHKGPPTVTVPEAEFEIASASSSSHSSGIEPSVQHGLIGLAISGGGIRSASFALGVIQSLGKYGLLRHFDYISTVSGGGFMGGCLVSLLSNSNTFGDRHNLPLRHVLGEREGIAMQHLRKSVDYLGSGVVNSLMMPVLILRGFVLNLLVIFPFLWAVISAKQNTTWGDCVDEEEFAVLSCFPCSKWMGINFLIHMLIFPLLSRPFLSLYLLFIFGVLGQPFIPANILEHAFDYSVIVSVILHAFMSYPYLTHAEGRKVAYDRTFGWFALGVLGMTFIEGMSVVEWIYRSLRHYTLNLAAIAILLIANLFVVTLLNTVKIHVIRKFIYQTFISIAGPALLIFFYLELNIIIGKQPLFSKVNLICITISLIGMLCLDINETSMHKYFRDRVSAAFLFKINEKGKVVPTGGDRLSEMNASNTAPYHLINATLNVSADEHELGVGVTGRGSDFFIFSKLFVGSMASGYRSSRVMEEHDRNLDVGTAISISGAAMAPHMGTSTIRSLVLAMGILNIRLGYWLPNPSGLFLTSSFFGRLVHGFAWLSLLREFGWPPLRSTDMQVNLSDGGHLENLGVYELLRRRCKFITVIDSENDVDLTFNGLATLMRLARLDFGCMIQINLDDLRPDPTTGFCKRRWTVGRIVYYKDPVMVRPAGEGPPPGDIGYLLYVKAALVGNEDEVIREYHSRSTDFPHESTAEQFFSEAQLEAYRSLGFMASGKSLFFSPQGEPLFDGKDVGSFFERLYTLSRRCGSLPEGWHEKRDEHTGMHYFETVNKKLKTWRDPRTDYFYDSSPISEARSA